MFINDSQKFILLWIKGHLPIFSPFEYNILNQFWYCHGLNRAGDDAQGMFCMHVSRCAHRVCTLQGSSL